MSLFAYCSRPIRCLGSYLVRKSTSFSTVQTGISSSNAKPLSAVPGPKGYALLIGALQARNSAGKDNIYHRLSHQYGPIVRVKLGFGQKTALLVSDPDAIETVLRSEGSWPSRSRDAEDKAKWIHNKNNIAESLAFSSGAEWKRLRSAVSKQVVPRRVSNYTTGLFGVSEALCNHFACQRDAEGLVGDISDAMSKWALKGISYVVFNEDINVFSTEDPHVAAFIKASQNFVESLSAISAALPIFKIYPTKKYKFYVTSVQNMHEIGRNLLKRHFDKVKAAIQVGSVDETVTVGLLDQWLIEGKLTEEEAIVQACDQLGAGVETTSNTGTFLLHELAKHPEIQEQVRQEVLKIVGPSGQPTFEHLQKMSLVRSCVRETLRLYPATPVTAREIMNDVNLFGYHIPAGNMFLVNLFTCGRDPKYFPNPETFNPHRWIQDKDKAHPFANIPFGFGPRMCYGRRIAELELYLLLVRVLQRFQLSTEQKKLKLTLKTALRLDGPVQMRFTDYISVY